MPNTVTREALIEELADLPEMGLYEVLDFIRFLKSQWETLGPEERFDRAWMIARRTAAEQGITDDDVSAEIEAVRQGERRDVQSEWLPTN